MSILNQETCEYNTDLIDDIMLSVLDGAEITIPIYRRIIEFQISEFTKNSDEDDQSEDQAIIIFKTNDIIKNDITPDMEHFVSGYIYRSIVEILKNSIIIDENSIQFSVSLDHLADQYEVTIYISER